MYIKKINFDFETTISFMTALGENLAALDNSAILDNSANVTPDESRPHDNDCRMPANSFSYRRGILE